MATDFQRMIEGFQRRDLVLEGEVRYLEKMRQEAKIRLVNPPSDKTYTLICDEGEHMGGDDTAPPPLAFFLAGILFCLMTKVPQYATVLKVPVDKVTMKGRWGMHTEGSALQGTLQTDPIGLDIEIKLDSDAPIEDLGRLVRVATRACYSTQAVRQAVPTQIQVEVKDVRLEQKLIWGDKPGA